MSRPFASLAPLRDVVDKLIEDEIPTPPTNQSLHFFDLPREVRDKIYRCLLDTQAVHFWNRGQYKGRFFSEETFTLLQSPWDLDTTVLRVGKQLYQEASTVFYKSNLFLRVTLFTPVVEFAEILLQEIGANVVFLGAKLELTENCTQHAADIKISINQSLVKRSQIIIPHTSLNPLVTFLSTLCNGRNAEHIPFSNIDIDIRNTYGLGIDVIQSNLLEPWRKIFNIPNVSLRWDSGPPDYLKGLKKDMTHKGFDANAWLKATTNLREHGNKTFENGMLENSIEYFEQALSSIRIVYQNVPGSRRPELIALDEDFSKAVGRIRYDCELNISMAWVNLEDRFEQARKSALNAFRICQEDTPQDDVSHKPPNQTAWYTDVDRATALFCYGSAAMAQGAFANARDDFEEAQRLNPYDQGISRAAELARRRLNEQ